MAREEVMADGDRELLIALEGHAAGKSLREIAEELHGAEVVAAEWSSDSVLRARMKRLLWKARSQTGLTRRRGRGGGGGLTTRWHPLSANPGRARREELLTWSDWMEG